MALLQSRKGIASATYMYYMLRLFEAMIVSLLVALELLDIHTFSRYENALMEHHMGILVIWASSTALLLPLSITLVATSQTLFTTAKETAHSAEVTGDDVDHLRAIHQPHYHFVRQMSSRRTKIGQDQMLEFEEGVDQIEARMKREEQRVKSLVGAGNFSRLISPKESPRRLSKRDLNVQPKTEAVKKSDKKMVV